LRGSNSILSEKISSDEFDDSYQKISEKFALKLPNENNKTIFCTFHPQIKAIYRCPICKRYVCENCFKYLYRNKENAKRICKNCRNRLIFKNVIYILIISYLILSLFQSIYNCDFIKYILSWGARCA
jgi:hypothetical protein